VLILLPPSEGKTIPGRGRPLRLEAMSFPGLTEGRAAVLDALLNLCTTDSADAAAKAATVLGLGKTQTDEVARNAALTTAATVRADRVYSGVLYEALDLPSMSGPARGRATRRLTVTSALFGLVRPLDAIPAYRLSGDVSLPGIGKVAAFWRQRLAGPMLEAMGRGLVLDLRSSTYASFWRPDAKTAPRTVTVRVLHEAGGTRTVVSHLNKATKGRLVRSLLEEDVSPRRPAGLADALADLGWTVVDGGTDQAGSRRLDVVVEDL